MIGLRRRPTAEADGVQPRREPVLELTGEATPVRMLFGDLWRYRSVISVLARSDFHSRYRSTMLGVVWSVLLPVIQGAVLAVVFTVVVPVRTDVPYPVFVMVGTLTWSYFTSSVSQGATAIVGKSAMATKVYFPRLILPTLPAASNFISYAISLLVVGGMMVFYGVSAEWTLLLVPVAMFMAAALAIAVAALTSLLHVYFRDTAQLVGAALMLWFYVTPVIYPPALADRVGLLITLNPAAGFIGLMRYAVFGEVDDLGLSLTSTLVTTVVLMIFAVFAYRRQERIAVDRL